MTRCEAFVEPTENLDAGPAQSKYSLSAVDMTLLRKSQSCGPPIDPSPDAMAAILDSISDGFFALDDELVVTWFNKAAENLLGKKSEEVIGRAIFEAFPEGKGTVFEDQYTRAVREKIPLTFEVNFGIAPYANWYDVRVFPQKNGITVFFQVTTERKKAAAERETLIRELQEALAKVKTLSSFIPICAGCRRLRNNEGDWQALEEYMRDHVDIEFTHGLCPDCLDRLYPAYSARVK